MSADAPEQSMERLMKPSEVAPLFNVRESTVKTWARRRKIPSLKTPGGEIRMRTSDVAAILGAPQPNHNKLDPSDQRSKNSTEATA